MTEARGALAHTASTLPAPPSLSLGPQAWILSRDPGAWEGAGEPAMGGRRTQGHSDLGQAPCSLCQGLPGVAGPLGESHELAHGQPWELLPLPLVSATRAPTGLIPRGGDSTHTALSLSSLQGYCSGIRSRERLLLGVMGSAWLLPSPEKRAGLGLAPSLFPTNRAPPCPTRCILRAPVLGAFCPLAWM